MATTKLAKILLLAICLVIAVPVANALTCDVWGCVFGGDGVTPVPTGTPVNATVSNATFSSMLTTTTTSHVVRCGGATNHNYYVISFTQPDCPVGPYVLNVTAYNTTNWGKNDTNNISNGGSLTNVNIKLDTLFPAAACNITSASITPYCGVAGCNASDKIQVNVSYDNCPSTSYVQINANSSGNLCRLQFASAGGGSMQGINVSCASSPCVTNWTIPSYGHGWPNNWSACYGRNVSAYSAAIYNDSAETGLQASLSSPSGYFIFSNNSAPYINPVILNQTYAEDSPTWSVDLTGYENDREDSGTNLNWSVSGVNTSLIDAQMVDVANDILNITPVLHMYGASYINLTLTDADGATVSQLVLVNITFVNYPPSFSFAVDDNSTAANPTNQGTNVVFTGTAHDIEGDNYTMFICTTSSFSAGSCTAGTICTSSSTPSDSQASCFHNTAGESGSVAWWAFAYDGQNVSAADNANSPYYVNRMPNAPSNGAPTTGHNITPTLTWTKGTDPDGNSVSTKIDIGTTPGGTDLVNSYVTSSASYMTPAMTYTGTSHLYYIQMWSSDQFGFENSTYYNWTYDLTNARPTATGVNINPNPAYYNNTLNCTYSFSDPDLDIENTGAATYHWYVNSVLQGSTGPTLSSGYVRSDTVKCAVKVQDQFGLDAADYVNSSNLVISNFVPTQAIVSITPKPTNKTNNLNCSASSTDADPSDTVTYYFSWYKNSVLNFSTSNIASPNILLSGNLTKGDIWNCTVIPTDGIANGTAGSDSVTIQNILPITGTPTLSPIPAYKTTPLITCTNSTTSDADGDSVTFHYVWYVNGANSGVTTQTIGNSSFNKGNQVICQITPDDGTANGTSVNSSALTISNTLPTTSIPTLSPIPAYKSTPTVTCTNSTTSDADNDVVNFLYLWFVNGANSGITTQTISNASFNKNDQLICQITPNDGSGDGASVNSSSLTISNSAPITGVPTLSPIPAYKNTSTVTCTNSTTSDLDGDSVTFYYLWFKNGADTGITTSTISNSSFVKNDQLICQITPFDGTANGTAQNSSSLTISNSPPTTATPTLSPIPAYKTTSTVTCTNETTSDLDNDVVTFNYLWYKNGLSTGITTQTISNSSFSKNDQLICQITPFDGTSNGAAVNSSALTISNTLPVTGTPILSPIPAYKSTPTVTCNNGTTSDLDGDSVTFNYIWFVNGANSGIITQTISNSAFNKNDQLICQITPYDGTGNGAAVNSSALTISNSVPVTGTPTLSPIPAYKITPTVTCLNGTTSDLDNDVVTFHYLWFVNGASSGIMTQTIGNSSYNRGDQIICQITPDDGTANGTAVNSSSLTISNSLPVTGIPTLSPIPAYKTTLNVTCTNSTTTDNDGDAVTFHYVWFVNGASSGITTQTISNSAFNKNDQLICQITPDDGINTGSAVNSSSLTISNSLPITGTPTLSPIPSYKITPTVTCTNGTTTDSDSDSVTFYYAWFKNGANSGITTQTISNSSFNKGDQLVCQITPFDGAANGTAVNSSALTISNSIPVTGIPTLSPIPAYMNTSAVTCTNGTTYDNDNEAVNFYYLWFINGTSSGITSQSITNASFNKGDQLICQIMPSDGTANGTAQNSTPLTIGNAVPTTPTTLTPITGTFGGTQNTIAISCSGSTDPDLGDVVNYTIDAFYNSAWQNLVTAGNGSYLWDISGLSSQTVDLQCKATDGLSESSYYNPAGNITIDNAAPFYMNDASNPPGNVAEGTTVDVSVLWQDNVNLSTAIFRTNQSGWANVSTCALSSTSDWCNTTINTTGYADNTICWNQYANDSMGNWNTTMPQTAHCFNVGDITPPSFNLVLPPTGTTYNQTQIVDLLAGVSEDSTVTANVSWDSTSQLISLIYNGTNWVYNETFTNTTFPGQYDVTFNATDTSGNSNTTTTYFIVDDVTAPSVTDINPVAGSNYSVYASVPISANVTDYYYDNIANVTANVTWDSTSQIVSLSYNGISGLYEGSFTNTSYLGQYNITIIATDNAGNVNDTETTYFNVVDNTFPFYSNDFPVTGGTVVAGTIVNISTLWHDDVALDTAVFRTNQSGSWIDNSTCVLSGTSYWCNATIDTTSDAGNTICWNEYANDTSGNLNNTMPEHCFDVTLFNTPPQTTTPVIDPAVPYTNDDLYCSATITDAEPGSLTAYWKWYKDGIENISGSTSVGNGTPTNITILGNGNTTKGEVWTCEITPNDGIVNGTAKNSTGVTIQNTLPTTPNILLSPANPNTTSDLVCTASGSTDLDLDLVTYFYEWYNGTTLMFAEGPQAGPSTLGNGNTTRDDVWNCTAIPFDGEGNGTANSTTVLIQNSPPTTPTTLILNSPEVGEDLVAICSGSTDADSDTITYYYEFNNTNDNSIVQAWGITSNYTVQASDTHNTIKVTCGAYDGTAYSVANITNTTAVGNTAPVISSLSVATPVIKGGMQQRVDAVGQGDADSDTLDFYCCNDTLDTCTPDILADTRASPYSGMNWTYSAPNIGYGTIYVRCLVSDGTANSSVVSANYIEDNSGPSISFYEPPTPLDGDRNIGNSVTIKANITNNLAIDTCLIEFDGTNYTMTQEGSGNSINCSYTNSSLVDGVTYTYVVYANDSVDNLAASGLRTFIENSLPVSSTPVVTPDPANTTDDLVCNATITDVEDPFLDANWTWYKNGEINETGQITSVPSGFDVGIPILSSVNTVRGENWSCSVLPYDGYEYGLQENSTNVTILNSPPSVDYANITPDPAYDLTDLTCENGSVSDADGDPVTLNYDWYNGTDWLGINSQVLGNGNTTPGDYWNCSITPFDGTDNGTTVISDARYINAAQCNITMGNYWNSISLCANPTNKSIESVLAGLDYNYVMRWNTTSQQFDIWSKDAPTNPFTEFETNESYFVFLNSGSVLTIPGTFNLDMNISMDQYWNEPAYPYEFNTTVEKAMSSINGSYEFVMKWNNAAQQFDIYSPIQIVKPFTDIFVGEGLLVYTNATPTLEYNRTALL